MRDNPHIYFDNNAATRLSPSVETWLKDNFITYYANPSSLHLLGQKLKDMIANDRRCIANFIGTNAKNIFFTSGATESINSVLQPIFLQEHGIEIVLTSRLEHSAVSSCVERLKRHSIRVLYINNDADGMLCPEHLSAQVKAHPHALVTLLGANNETGVVQDVAQLTAICRAQDCLVHLDGVQMLGKLPVNLEEMGVDYASFSAHKIGGLKGMGVTYAREPAQFTPLIIGGGQEEGLRGGTYNAGAIRSLRLALEDTRHWDLEKIASMRDFFECAVKNLKTKAQINCENSFRLCNTSNIHLPNQPADAMVMELARRGIYVATGSACHGAEPSHVLQGLGFNKDYAASCLRFSFANFNHSAEIEYALEVLHEVIDS
ncbi:MAG: cysteine desulfurase family protein [Pseudomonadota bacterium]|nr:cysteine desulfurase family protein [Pseudomonadota bacterium]